MTAPTIHGVARRFGAPTRGGPATARKTGPGIKSTPGSRARLSLILLVYFVGIIGVVMLAPFRFAIPGTIHLLTSTTWSDVATGVLLWVPLGFLYPLTRRTEFTSLWRVCGMGILLSGVLGSIRLFEGDGDVSSLGIAANAAGAVIGGILLHAVNRRILASRLSGRLSLEIPLMGLIYLLLPLLFVVSLSTVGDPVRLLSLLPLGLLGACLIAAVQEFHWGPAGVFRHRAIVLIAAGWMALGAFPALLHHPLLGAGLVIAVALGTWTELSRPAIHGSERRFEADVLRRAAPYVACFILMITFLPLSGGVGHWRVAIRLTGADGDLTRQMILLLEPIASLTVLGYVLAEWRGRRELPFRAVAARVTVECGSVAVAIETCRGFERGVGVSAAQLALTIGAGLLGAAIYHQQRERVRWILIRHQPASARMTSAA